LLFISGTLAGGLGAELSGGNFWQGAATGLIVSGLNHFAHQVQQRIRVIDNNKQAVEKYYYGDGSPAELGPNTKQALINSNEYQNLETRLINGVANRRSNTFDVDLTFDGAFFVGDTNVDYSTSCAIGKCTTTFNAFVRDGFWDPAGIGVEIPIVAPGTVVLPHPYPFIPYTFSITYTNPGYQIGNNIK